MDRKQFIISACALCTLGATATLLDSCYKAKPVDFTLNLNDASNAALANVGGYVIANGGNTIVFRTASGYTANSLDCTHEGVIVSYTPGSGYRCPKHGSTFDTSGHVTGGPATKDLPSYQVTQSGNILTVKGQ